MIIVVVVVVVIVSSSSSSSSSSIDHLVEEVARYDCYSLSLLMTE